MKKTILLIMGRSGSGKSTLERALVERWPDTYNKVVSGTTRQPREGEQDGVDYHFITKKQYDETIWLQTTFFHDTHYGSALSEYATPHSFSTIVVVPGSAKEIIDGAHEYFGDEVECKIVLFCTTEELSRRHMLARGDAPEQVDARLANDTLLDDFFDSELTADYVINDRFVDEGLTDRVHGWLA